MKKLLACLVTLCGVLAVFAVLPMRELRIVVPDSRHDYIVDNGTPLVGFVVPASEINELTFNGQTSFSIPAESMNFETPVGCTNITDFWWPTTVNRNYKIMKLQDGQWVYTKIKVIGNGTPFHFYDFSNFSNRFLVTQQ